MHPIEHLRYVARARGADATSLVREAATALASLRADHANLVIAGRRIVERHPEVGPLWWMCASLLTCDYPPGRGWVLGALSPSDPTPRRGPAALPDAATVLTVGWPELGGAGLMARGDVRVLCADSRFEASGFLQRLERYDVECEPVPAESIARAAAVADVVLVEAVAAARDRVLAPVGSHVLAAVARSVDTPVWLVAGVGRRLPTEYVDAIAGQVVACASGWDVDIDDLPLDLVTHVVTEDGLGDAAALRPDCPFAPELLRTSPF